MRLSVTAWRPLFLVSCLLLSGSLFARSAPARSPLTMSSPARVAGVGVSVPRQATRPATPPALAARALLARYGQLPLRFESNRGQTAAGVRFLARGAGYTLFLTGSEAVLSLAGSPPTDPSACGARPLPGVPGGALPGRAAAAAAQTMQPSPIDGVSGPRGHEAQARASFSSLRNGAAPDSCPATAGAGATVQPGQPGQLEGSVLRLRFLGAASHPAVTGQDLLPGQSNYLTGRDAHAWLRAVPAYARVVYHNLYPGVDLAYHGRQDGRMEYDLTLAPGADPRRIRLFVRGAGGSLRLDRAGNLLVPEAGKTLRQDRPVVYQQIAGRQRAVAGRYVLYGGDTVGFRVGRYDHGRPLVIDPVLVYSTLLGGSGGGGGGDSGSHVAVDGAGNVFVTGTAYSPNFPTTTGAYSRTLANTYRNSPNAFVSELSADGSHLIYSTYLGGNGGFGAGDGGSGIALPSGCQTGCAAYVVGDTYSPDFPTTTGAYSRTLSTTTTADLFITELSGDGGSLLYSTYLGGSKQNFAYIFNGFINNGNIAGIAVDGTGHAFVTGNTYSSDFPTTTNALSPTMANTQSGFSEPFLSELDPTRSGASSLVYSTYLGGSGGARTSSGTFNDVAYGIAVDGAGHPYVTGEAASRDFPTTPNAYARGPRSTLVNAFVSEFDTTMSGSNSLLYSTYLGGFSFDYGAGIATDPAGHAYLTGYTNSSDFPTTTNAYSRTIGTTNGNAFVSELDTAISGTGSLVYSSFLGGSGGFRFSFGVVGDGANGIAADGAGRAYVIGSAYSPDFPTTANAYARAPAITATAFRANVFVSELDTTVAGPNGLAYSTYLDGSGFDTASSIALAPRCASPCAAYLVGTTSSPDFPTTSNAISRTLGSSNGNAFVSELDASMSGASSLRYSTYLGGSGGTYGGDRGNAIAVDGSGHAYVAGSVRSATFPTTTNAYSPTIGGYGATDTFVSELSPDGGSLVYSTYFGGSTSTTAYGIALPPRCTGSCPAYIAGTTFSPDFPTTSNAVARTLPVTASHAFVSELSGDGSALVYSTLLGGSSSDFGSGIAVDAAGHAYVTGSTGSTDFPTTTTAYSRTLGTTHGNAFVTELDPSQSGANGLVYSTFLGGGGATHRGPNFTFVSGDYADGIAPDPTGHIYVTGEADSPDFPTTTNAYSRTIGTIGGNAFVSELDPTQSGANSLLYSTFLGGSSFAYGTSIATDPAGHAFITGEADSADFPTTTNAYSRTIGTTGGNAFMSELDTTISGTASLLYSTFLGGSSFDYGQGIAVDSAGRAFVTGEADSRDFPTTTNAYSRTLTGRSAAFVSELDPTITGTGSLVYSTFLGGSGAFDYGNGIAVDAADNAYVTGQTASPDFPTTAGAFQRTLRAPFGNAFVARFDLSSSTTMTPTATPSSSPSPPTGTSTTTAMAATGTPTATTTTAAGTPTATTTTAPSSSTTPTAVPSSTTPTPGPSSATPTAVPSSATPTTAPTSMPTATATATATNTPTATSTATATSTPTATATATNTPTSTSTATPTSTATNTPVPPTATSTSTGTPTNAPTATTIPATAIPATATLAPVSSPTLAPTVANAPSPVPTIARSCAIRELLIYPRPDRPHDHRYSRGRPVVIVEGVRGAGRRITSRTPLFVDDGHGTLFFSTKSYTGLVCGRTTLLALSGTVRHGSGVDQRRHRHANKPVSLVGARFRVVVTQRTITVPAPRGHSRRGRASTRVVYDLQVLLPRLGYDKTTRGLQGIVE